MVLWWEAPSFAVRLLQGSCCHWSSRAFGGRRSSATAKANTFAGFGAMDPDKPGSICQDLTDGVRMWKNESMEHNDMIGCGGLHKTTICEGVSLRLQAFEDCCFFQSGHHVRIKARDFRDILLKHCRRGSAVHYSCGVSLHCFVWRFTGSGIADSSFYTFRVQVAAGVGVEVGGFEDTRAWAPESRTRMSSSETMKILPYLEFGKLCIMGKRGARV